MPYGFVLLGRQLLARDPPWEKRWKRLFGQRLTREGGTAPGVSEVSELVGMEIIARMIAGQLLGSGEAQREAANLEP